MRDRLVKLLMMTATANDGEALNAIRLANQLLAREGKSWREMLFPPEREPERKHRGPEIREMLDVLKRTQGDLNFAIYVATISSMYERNGYLGASAFASLKNAYARRKKRPRSSRLRA